MVKWIAGMALGVSDAVNKAHEAIDSLTTTLDESMSTMSKRIEAGKRGSIASAITGTLDTAEFKNNIAEGVSTALISAGSALDARYIADAWFGRIMDSVYHIVGSGMADGIAQAAAKALTSLSSSMGSSEFSNFLKDTKLAENLEAVISPTGWTDAAVATTAFTGTVSAGILAVGAYNTAVAAGATGLAALAAPISAAIAGVALLGVGIWKSIDAFEQFKGSSADFAQDIVSTLTAVNEGTLSPALAVEKISGTLKMSREDAIQFYSDVTAAAKAYHEVTKNSRDSLKSMVDNFKTLASTREAFSKGMLQGGDLKDFSDSFKRSIKNIEDIKLSHADKFKALKKEGLFDAGMGNLSSKSKKQLDYYNNLIDEQTKKLADIQSDPSIKGEEKKGKVSQAQGEIRASQALLAKEQSATYNRLYSKLYKSILKEKGLKLGSVSEVQKVELRGITAVRLAEKLAHGNATKQYELELTLATRAKELSLDKVHLAQFGNSALKETALTEQKLLKIQADQLRGRLQFANLGEAETANIKDQIANIEREINNAGKTAVKWDEHLHSVAGTVQTVSDKIKAMRKDQGGMTDIAFANWRMDLINTEINAFNNSLDDTFESAQKVASVLSAIKEGGVANKDNLRKKFKNAFPDEKSFKNIAKWVKMATTSQGKAITARMEVLNAEETSRQLTVENWGKHEDLLAYRERIAEMEREYSEQGLKDEYEKLKLKETQAAISVMEAQLVVAEWSALTSGFAEAMKGVSDGFAEGVSAFVSSKLLDRDESGDDKWYVALGKTLSTGLATGVGDMVGKFAQQQVFGNKGFLSQGVGSLFGKDFANTLFPKTNQEKLREALKELKDAAIKRAAILEKIKVNTGSTAANTTVVNAGPTGSSSNSFANLSVLQDKYKELSKAGYQVKQTAEAINAAYKLLHPSKFEDSQVGGFSVSMGDRTVEIPPALAKFFDTMEIVAKGTESDTFEGHKKAGYSLEGFADVEKGKTAFYAAIAKDFDIPKDSILFKNADYFLQASGKFAVMSSGTTKNGTGLNGMTDGATQGIFLDQKGGLNSAIHEAVHPLFDKFSTLAKDSDNFDKYSSKSSITLWEKTLAYVESLEFASKTQVEKKRIVQTLDVGKYEEKNRIEEYVVRAIAQNSRLPEGSVPSDWLPEFMQKAMPEVIAEMDRLSTPTTLKAFDASVEKSSNSLSKMDNNVSAVIKVVSTGSKFLQREYAKIEAAIVKMFPRNNNGKYIQKGQEGYDLPYKDFAKQQGQKESAFRKGSQYRARETLKDAGKHEKGMYENSIQSDFLTHGRASSMQPSLFPQPDLPFGKPIPPAEPSIWTKVAPLFEKLNTALMFLMPNENIMDTKTERESLSDLPKGIEGALKVHEVNPEAKDTTPSGVPKPVISPTGDAATGQLSHDLRSSMAANLNSQIQNDNLNAKALITNSLSTVGSNLMSDAISSIFGFANGGVATGGFRAFANGGTVKQPTLGLVGEGRYNEAVVPLPDGKSIPVIGSTGSTENNVTVNVTVDSNGNAKSDTQSGMDGDQAKQLGYMVSQAVQAELVEQQRHGGLLSSY